MFGIKRKPDPLFMLSLFVGIAALFTTVVSASESAGDVVNLKSNVEFNIPFISGFSHADPASFSITRDRKGNGLVMSFQAPEEKRNTYLRTGVSQRELKDLIEVNLSYRISW